MSAVRASARISPAPGRDPRGGAGLRRVSLPHRVTLTSRYGSRVAHLPVYTGPAVRQALRRRGADGAAVDGAVFLPATTATLDVVAHEVVHALQQRPTTSDGEALLDRLEHGSVAPAEGAAEHEAGALEGGPAEGGPAEAVPPGVVALRRLVGPAPERSATGTSSSSSSAPEPARPGSAPEVQRDGPGPGPSSSAAGDAATAPTFTPPAVPDTALDPAEAAAREAAKQEAEAALAAADSPSAVMAAYAGMAPSVKAASSADLGSRIAGTTDSATAELAADTPQVSARLSGEEGDLPAPPPVVVPGATAASPRTDPAAPPIDVPSGPEQPTLRPDPGYGPMIERTFASGASPEAVGEQIEDVSTRNPGIETRVVDRADIPLQGANDPGRMDEDTRTRAAEAADGRRAAADAVVTGPGPESVAPREMEHSVALDVPSSETAAVPRPEGAAQLDGMALAPEVVARFDEDTGPAMAASAETARAGIAAAENERDTAHDEAVRTAEAGREDAERQADTAQRDTIVRNRESIQSERQRTVDRQQAEVDRVRTEAETARAEHRTEADERVAADRGRIDARYDEAERDARAEVSQGESRAESERRQAERESEDQSWWDRATSFIRRAFEALTSAITAIFDAVRAAVTAVIDAAVSAVTAIIEAAAAALQALVSAFGELLKGLVDALLAEIFPELAAALTRFIDERVAAVNAAIDRVAATLVAAVEAVGAALQSAVNALLDAFQSALNGALALLEAAMTGDWSGLLLKVLDAVLGLLGIDPAAFHAMIAQASDAVATIVDDPGRFVRNLLDAVVGGVRQFAGNFGTHLRDGIIGWLTGALGGIQMPERWDLFGVLDIARQILGLTWDFVRERAARIIGEQNVTRLEAAFSWITTLVTEGWSGLWNRISGELQNLKDMVMDAIRGFVLERVVMASIRWLASLFNPVGALVQLVMTIWNIYQFVANQLQRLFGIAQAVVRGMADIAHGVLGPAMQRVEEVLANLLPVVIDLLMSLLGVTGVATRVREIIGDVRADIARAVDAMLDRVLGALGLRRGGADAAAAPGDEGAAGGEQLTGNLVQQTFSMNGHSHTLALTSSGGRAAVTIASVRAQDIRTAAQAGRDEARAKGMDAQVIEELGQIIDQAERYDRWVYDNYEALVLPARDDHEQANLQSRTFFDLVLHSAIEFGRQHHLADLVGLGHPSMYVLNDEIRTEYRNGWRERFYKVGWSSSIDGAWKETELDRLGREAARRFPANTYVQDPGKKAFLVEDRNHQYPPTAEVDFIRPRNVHIDHVRSVSDHFQSDGRNEVQSERLDWYERQSNLQILNERWNTAKGGPRVDDWHVTLRFRGPNERGSDE